MIKEIQQSLQQLREKKPLILCLTNTVSMELIANCLLALGALPLMSQSIEELDELIAISQGLTLNIGTLDLAFISRSEYAAKKAQQRGLPIVLDPVGAGASQLRTQTARNLSPFANIVRGNASEIMALAGVDGGTRGVDSHHHVSSAHFAAQSLAEYQVIMVSGEVDYVCYKKQHNQIPYGSALMPLVTGMGCSLTAVIAAFAACDANLYRAALTASQYFALCGQVTAQNSSKPGTFRQMFIDQLFAPDWDAMKRLAGE